jgi:hypothetical protein
LRHTRRTVPITFSIILVQASERRSSFGNPSRVTVRISSMPSRIELATPDQSRSRRWARCAAAFQLCRRRPAPMLVATRGADAGFLANARKGKLAALTVVILSSCRRVLIGPSLFMGSTSNAIGVPPTANRSASAHNHNIRLCPTSQSERFFWRYMSTIGKVSEQWKVRDPRLYLSVRLGYHWGNLIGGEADGRSA